MLTILMEPRLSRDPLCLQHSFGDHRADDIARILILHDSIGHPRFFGRDRTIYELWHYMPVLVNKPGALRN